LEEAIKPVYEELDKFEFGEMLRVAREAVGLKLYRVSEFLGISPARLKNLETGYFRTMPVEAEIEAIAKLYDIKYSVVKQKAQDHVDEHTRAKKVRMDDEDEV
jgi:transcriptional regulator with XRE-family HTH domain